MHDPIATGNRQAALGVRKHVLWHTPPREVALHKGLVEGVQDICVTILDQHFCQLLEQLVEGRLCHKALSHHLDPLHD